MKAKVKRVITPLLQHTGNPRLKVGDIVDVPDTFMYRFNWALDPAPDTAQPEKARGRVKARKKADKDKMYRGYAQKDEADG